MKPLLALVNSKYIVLMDNWSISRDVNKAGSHAITA
jgi:hypothetical protein